MKENQQQHKDSLITDHNSKEEALHEDELADLSQPQLKYMMSVGSEEEIVQMNELNEIAIQTQPPKINETNKRSKRTRKTRIAFEEQISENSFELTKNTTPCKCTKSNCLKLYCQCFHRNVECTVLCKCYDCKNCEKHLSIRQNALEKIKLKSQRQKHDDDLFDRTKIWGCRCQKSQCQKNYCECYVRNQKCTSECMCKDCANKKKVPSHFRKKKKLETNLQCKQN